MRVFISSTPEELEPHQVAACEVARSLGFEPVLRNPAAGRGLDPVRACARQVAAADAMLAIVGWRRGSSPAPELGGDGLRPWTYWEVRGAFDRGKPVAVLMAGESWRPDLREEDPKAGAVIQDFRGELHRLAIFFDEEPGGDGLNDFRELVRRQLREVERGARSLSISIGSVRLNHWPPPRLPEAPYPVLLPYTHPDLLPGRDRELDELREMLLLGVPIVGVYASSGTGKSSLLAGGLVPSLRAAGRPVAFDRHPCEAGIVTRLLGDLLVAEDAGDLEMADDEPLAFVDRLRVVQRLGVGLAPNGGVGEPSALVLDQFEDLLRHGEARRARAVIGALLAASVQRLPGLAAAPCRWLLAYREEFHGEVVQWLGDVLRDARAENLEVAASLPHDLSAPDRFHAWPLGVLAAPEPGSSEGVEQATRVFLSAIEKPLTLTAPEGGQRYPWRFAPGHAERLARAFGEARIARPDAPLAPELQVVLAHLLERARGSGVAGAPTVVEVPEEPGELIEAALEEHLRHALDSAFPAGWGRDAQLGRTRALLALRELAEVQGQRAAGLPVESLARAIGAGGREVLEKLATPQTRLVVLQELSDGGWCYALSHDRLAEVLVRLVDAKGQGRFAGFGVDAKLLSLRRFVALQSALFEAGEVSQATDVPWYRFRLIGEHRDALLWSEQQQRWWKACRDRRRRDRQRAVVRRGLAAIVVGAVAFGGWSWGDRWTTRKGLLEKIRLGEPETAFAALAELTADGVDRSLLLARLRDRELPLDVLERGLGGVDSRRREEAVAAVVELALPLLEEAPEDPFRIANMVWALDFFALREPATAERAQALRDAVLTPLRARHPPPDPGREGVDRVAIPAGTFWMGTDPGEGRDEEDKMDERPKHKVKLSAFWMMTREVTFGDYRRLVAGHMPDFDAALPVSIVSWHAAYTYAAWLGGRLPTEAEWEYAARAGCDFAYCGNDGGEAALGEVAWWVGNATDPETFDTAPRPPGQLEPNPWGLYDIFGNLREMSANWYGPYPKWMETDPPGPTHNEAGNRSGRGGSVWDASDIVVPAGRPLFQVDGYYGDLGFRVVWEEEPGSR